MVANQVPTSSQSSYLVANIKPNKPCRGMLIFLLKAAPPNLLEAPTNTKMGKLKKPQQIVHREKPVSIETKRTYQIAAVPTSQLGTFIQLLL